MTLKNAATKGVKAWRDRRVGYWLCIDPKTGEYYLLTSEAKQQAIERSEWVLCHGAGYYTARTPDGRDIIGKGENGVFVGGEYRRVVVRVHKATESIEVYFGMERNGLISALEVGGDHFEAELEYYRRETRPATEAEEKEAVKYLRARNYTHFKLSKRLLRTFGGGEGHGLQGVGTRLCVRGRQPPHAGCVL